MGLEHLGATPGKKNGLLFKACVLHTLGQHATELPCKMLPCVAVAPGTRKALSWDPAWPVSSLETGGEMVGCRFSGLSTIAAAARKDFPSERRQFGSCALCSGKLLSTMPTLLLQAHIVDRHHH